MTEDESRTLMGGAFGKELLKAATSVVSPIFWATKKKEGWSIDSNGTGFFVDLGHGPFLVTAAHVYEGYLEAKSTDMPFISQLGDIKMDFSQRLICCLGSKHLDVVTFKVTQEEIEASGKHVIYGPSKRIGEKEGVLFAGYPGGERIETNELECNFGQYVAVAPVSSVSDRHYGCAFERSAWLDAVGNGIPPEGYNLGGISGAPALALCESEAGVMSWSLCGIIYNASTELAEIVFAHHADCIQSDGYLKGP